MDCSEKTFACCFDEDTNFDAEIMSDGVNFFVQYIGNNNNTQNFVMHYLQHQPSLSQIFFDFLRMHRNLHIDETVRLSLEIFGSQRMY
jgi:hypothetical protein